MGNRGACDPRGILFVLTVVLLAAAAGAAPALADGACDRWLARAAVIEGSIAVRRAGRANWTAVKAGDVFAPGDRIRVGRHSRAVVVLCNETQLRLDQETVLTLYGGQGRKRTLLEILRGVINFFSRVPRSLEVMTPFVNGSLEGTEFLVAVAADSTRIVVFDGRVAAANRAGSLRIAAGQAAVARRGRAPQPMTLVRPRDAVNWALYYPTVLSPRTPGSGGPAAGFVRRAADLLSVGRVDAARAQIAEALAVDPGNSRALALEAVMAVVQNRREKAFELAAEAVKRDPRSAAARIALSYAQQARFEIGAALETLREAVRLDPRNALALARLSELWLSVGEPDKALSTARRAVALEPDIGRTQVVLGFAHLARIEIAAALAAFQRAIALEPAAPLARLGQGLARIREGQLEEGRADIEIAAALDPNNSLIRSYLGKAFYEEKRSRLARNQFRIAKQLDPRDPTPYLYDALLKQSVNRPVEALHDLQRSIALNDNRAVYRSRLLLDQDLAVRSARLAQIYNELNFGRLALVEGWKSLSRDPADYSAHRFLADAYLSQPRHEIARASELLQSQLLQPLSISPVQLRMSEIHSFILRGTGPAQAAFNEYTPLFSRNRLALLASGVAGGRNTYGDEITQSGLWNKLSYSVGQFHYRTDGFRENNDQDQKAYNVFVQAAPWYHTSFLAEYRHTTRKFGDLPLRFDPQMYSPDERHRDVVDSIRLGGRHAFSPRSELIATVVYNDTHFKTGVDTYGFGFDEHDRGFQAESQHLYRATRFNVVAGAGFLQMDQGWTVRYAPYPDMRADDVMRHANAYVYSQIHFPDRFTWTLGASADHFNGLLDKDRLNPKLGVRWHPFAGTTLRAAAFRVMTRSLMVSTQTVEPTQVAGFNQFYNGYGGDEAWHYGVALDQRFSDRLFGGVAFSRRDMDVAYLNIDNRPDETAWEEKVVRVYLDWAPLNWLTGSLSYQWERLDRDPAMTGFEMIHVLRTHRVPLALNVYLPNGLSAHVTTSYVDQRGMFDLQPLMAPPTADSDTFWVVDAAVRYRLPRRWGMVSIEAKNLFDQRFRYQPEDYTNPDIVPELLVLAKVTLSF